MLQVVPGIDKKKASADSVSLVEVGPRVCLNPIKIFGGSFGGPVLFDNPHFVSPNRVGTPLWRSVLHSNIPPHCLVCHRMCLLNVNAFRGLFVVAKHVLCHQRNVSNCIFVMLQSV